MIRLIDLLKEDIIEAGVTSTIEESLPLITQLGDKTVLTRTFSGVRSGIAKVTTTPPKKQSIDPDIIQVFDNVMDHLDFDRLIYCSHGNRRFIQGDQYIMVPGDGYKIAWSSEINDLLVDAKEYQKEGKLDQFPYDSYKTDWPIGDVSEILVDCDVYYMISPRLPIIEDYMRKQKLGTYDRARFIPNKIETYSQLRDILSNAIMQYKK